MAHRSLVLQPRTHHRPKESTQARGLCATSPAALTSAGAGPTDAATADMGAKDSTSFAVQLVDIDVVCVTPTELDSQESPLTGLPLRHAPVIRIFGATPRGQKVLLHVHGAFRYFLVPFDNECTDTVSLRQLAEELECEMRRSDMFDKSGRQALVLDMSIKQLTPFYGYHEEAWPFLRVAMAMPAHVEFAARLFARGFCHRSPRQPHEAHVGHLLQFKVDHNCLGMDHVRLARVRWRGALPEHTMALPLEPPCGKCGVADGGFRFVWTRGQAHGLALQSPAMRTSSMELEADALCGEILNVNEAVSEPLRSAQADVFLCQSLNQIWLDASTRCTALRPPGLDSGGNSATPHSAAARRSVLPSLPMTLAPELRVIDELLAKPPPLPSESLPSLTSELPLLHTAPYLRIKPPVELLQHRRTADSAASRAGAANDKPGGNDCAAGPVVVDDTVMMKASDSFTGLLSLDAALGGGYLAHNWPGNGSQLSTDAAAMVAHLDQCTGGNMWDCSSSALDEKICTMGCAGHGRGRHVAQRCGLVSLLWPRKTAVNDPGGSLDEPAAGEETEAVEVVGEEIGRLLTPGTRRHQAERIGRAVQTRAPGVASVSLSENTGTVQVEVSLDPWLRDGIANHVCAPLRPGRRLSCRPVVASPPLTSFPSPASGMAEEDGGGGSEGDRNRAARSVHVLSRHTCGRKIRSLRTCGSSGDGYGSREHAGLG